MFNSTINMNKKNFSQKENPCLCLIVKLLDNEQKIEDNIPLLNILLEKNTILENVRKNVFISRCAPYLTILTVLFLLL